MNVETPYIQKGSESRSQVPRTQAMLLQTMLDPRFPKTQNASPCALPVEQIRLPFPSITICQK